MTTSNEPGTAAKPVIKGLSEVKYSLPEMLAELEQERSSAAFTHEKLEQSDISKLFKFKRPSHVKPKN